MGYHHVGRVGIEEDARPFFVYGGGGVVVERLRRIASIVRILACGGDMLHLGERPIVHGQAVRAPRDKEQA